MAELSENFKTLAASPARRVSCRIIMGSTVFTDERIIEFDFDDVTHKDWFTIGTTCSNMFSFAVVDYTLPELHTTVQPFVSFDGKEWCPLGIFYIARRIIRGVYARYVCYDKMNDLDEPFDTANTSDSVLTNARALLQTVCARAGITFNGDCVQYTIPKLTYASTYREIIGYIAALNCACAKFNRDGVLEFIGYTRISAAALSSENCYHVNCNITLSAISSLRVDTGEKILKYGVNSGENMVYLFNPLMTQNMVNNLGERLKILSFYGAEIEMQGLPYLRSGDFINLKKDDMTRDRIIISEIKYHYDGGLSAKLYSRNKENSDAAVPRNVFENEIEKIWEYIKNK